LGYTYWAKSIEEYYSNWRNQKVPLRDLGSIQEEYKQREAVKKIKSSQKTIEALNAKYGADRGGKKKRKPRSKKGKDK
jgi:hypothetical protein